MDPYLVMLVIVGVVTLGAAVLPMILADRIVSVPMVYVVVGVVLFATPLDLPTMDPVVHGSVAVHVAEFVVIVSLMAAGLKLDRPFSWSAWTTTRRLLVVAMPLSIAAVAFLGWSVAGLTPVAALLLGSVLAPTDPVLASDVQVGPPGKHDEEEDDVRFTVTSEAGLNDGLAFPFVNLAVAMAAAVGSSDAGWVGGWVLEDVVLKLSIGALMGWAGGKAIGWMLFRLPSGDRVASSTEGFVALAATLMVYGITELAQGYGFLAVFLAACVIRAQERSHKYHEVLHASAESIERFMSAVLLIALGGAVVDGILGPLTLGGIAIAVAVVLVVRPVSATVALLATSTPVRERRAIAFFGVRGVGSVFYLAYALNEQTFEGARELWAITALVILLSVVVHGLAATPAMRWLDEQRNGPFQQDRPPMDPLPRRR